MNVQSKFQENYSRAMNQILYRAFQYLKNNNQNQHSLTMWANYFFENLDASLKKIESLL